MAGNNDALADTTENQPGFGLSWIIGPEPDPSVDALTARALRGAFPEDMQLQLRPGTVERFKRLVERSRIATVSALQHFLRRV